MLAQGFLCVIHLRSRIFSLSISSHSFQCWNNMVFHLSTFHCSFNIWTHRYSQSFINDETFVCISAQILNTKSLDYFPKKYLIHAVQAQMSVKYFGTGKLQSKERKRDSFLRQMMVPFGSWKLIKSLSLWRAISVHKTLKSQESKTTCLIFL